MSLEIPSLNWVSIAPHLALAGGGLLLLAVAVTRLRRNVTACVTLALATLAVGFVLAVRSWSHSATGFAGMVSLDTFGISFTFIFLAAAALTILLSLNHLERGYLLYADYLALILFATLGMMLLASATNLVMVFVGLETLSVSLYVLAGQRRSQLHSLEAALKYFVLGAFATGFFLYGVALVYGSTGSLDLESISQFIRGGDGRAGALFGFGLLMLLVGFGFKIALVPFHMWTPDVYQGAPAPVSGFMATGSKAAAFAALTRVLLGAVGQDAANWAGLLWILAVLTMTVGNVIAVVQDNVKRMLAYSSIAHAGYILVGIVAANELTSSSVLFYLLVYAFMNIGAFGVLSALSDREGEVQDIARMAGLGYRKPLLGVAMAVFMFALAGIPPTAGFMAKFYVFSAALKSGYLWLVIIGVVNSMISVYYYLRVVVYMYMREPEGEVSEVSVVPAVAVGLAVATLAVLYLGIYPSTVMDLFRRAVMLLG